MHGAAWFDGCPDVGAPARPRSAGGLAVAAATGSPTRGAPVPLLVPRGLNLRADRQCVVSRCSLPAEDVLVRHRVRCLVPERAVVDVVLGSADLRAAVTALDMALSAGVTTALRVRARVAGPPRARGGERVLQALALAEDRVLSPMETWLRLVWVLDAGLPRPRCNWPVADLTGRRLGRPDLLCEELGVVVEYDGAEHRSRARHGLDVRREADFRDAGLEVVTVVATDVPHPDRVVARMQAAVDRSRAADRPRGWMMAARPGRI